jgi:uncharacterized membrane protein
MMHGLEATVVTVADFLQVIFEAASILVVAAGGVAFFVALVARGRSTFPSNARLVFAKYLIVALELQLAADIIATATDPSLQELGKLAAIAVIRTFLNYFLVAEIRAEKEKG